MTDIQTNEFFAPANTNLLDGLVAEYRHKRSLIERFYGDFKDGDIGRALTYFCQQEGAVYPRFDLQAAICAVNAEYWKKALALTDVYKYMPQARKDSWNEQLLAWKSTRYQYGKEPEKDLPDFTEEAAKEALMTWLQERPKYLAERVEGVFNALSKEHITNCPQGFGKRMILAGLVDKGGTIDYQRAGYIDDLRMAISKFMNRGEFPQSGSRADLEVVRRRNGEWFPLDGGALRVRVYNGVGTAHIEVNPDMAWRLNEILAYLYPAAIPESFRRKPKKQKKIKDFELFDDVLPFAVCRVLSGCKEARRLNPNRGYNETPLLPIHCSSDIPTSNDRAIQKAAESVLVSLGGVKTKLDNSSYYQFDYDPLPVIAEIAASGRIPNQQSHQFYPTPGDVAAMAIEYANEGYSTGLWGEFSAGTGAIAMMMPVDKTICVEISDIHCKALETQGYAEVVCADFMKWQTDKKFARVVINPPYSEGRWRAHTEKAANHIADAGKMVAVLPASAKDKFELPGFACRYSEILKNRFAGTGIDVVLLIADKLQ